jgi:hypothetical protein
MNKLENLLTSLLECGVLDLGILEKVEYNLGELVEKAKQKTVSPTLNDIVEEIFLEGQQELVYVIKDKIEEKEDEEYELLDEDDTNEEKLERIRNEIEELESLNPYEDMGWECNGIDTCCWFENNADIYYKYMQDEIKEIEESMGFEF